MKRYFVKEGRKKYLKMVLKRDHIPYQFEKNNGRDYVWVSLSCRQYRILREDAECEYEREQHTCNIPIYSLHTLRNPEKLKRLKELNSDFNSFGILSKDVEKFEKLVG